MTLALFKSVWERAWNFWGPLALAIVVTSISITIGALHASMAVPKDGQITLVVLEKVLIIITCVSMGFVGIFTVFLLRRRDDAKWEALAFLLAPWVLYVLRHHISEYYELMLLLTTWATIARIWYLRKHGKTRHT